LEEEVTTQKTDLVVIIDHQFLAQCTGADKKETPAHIGHHQEGQ